METTTRTRQLKDIVAEIEDLYIDYDPNQGNLVQSKNTLKRRVGRALEKRSLKLNKPYKGGKADPYVAAGVIYDDIKPYLLNHFFKRKGVAPKSQSLREQLIREENEALGDRFEEMVCPPSPAEELAALGVSLIGLYGETFDGNGNIGPIKSTTPLKTTDACASRVHELDVEIRKMFHILERQIAAKVDGSRAILEHTLRDLPQMRMDIEIIKIVLLRLLQRKGETFNYDQYTADIYHLQRIENKSDGSAANLTEDEVLEREKLVKQMNEPNGYFSCSSQKTA